MFLTFIMVSIFFRFLFLILVCEHGFPFQYCVPSGATTADFRATSNRFLMFLFIFWQHLLIKKKIRHRSFTHRVGYIVVVVISLMATISGTANKKKNYLYNYVISKILSLS